MTHSVQRGLDAARSDQDLARLASLRQRAKALGLSLDTPEHTIAEAEVRRRGNEAMRVGAEQLRARIESVRESQVEKDGDKLMQSCGFSVIRFSQPRASKQTPGIPDRFYLNPTRGLAVFWEAKRQGGKQSVKQREFQALCDACGIPYVVGTTEPLRQWLTNQLEK